MISEKNPNNLRQGFLETDLTADWKYRKYICTTYFIMRTTFIDKCWQMLTKLVILTRNNDLRSLV